jgi:hypothetical protein
MVVEVTAKELAVIACLTFHVTVVFLTPRGKIASGVADFPSSPPVFPSPTFKDYLL